MGGKSGGGSPEPDHSALRHRKKQDRAEQRRRQRGQQMVDAYFEGGRPIDPESRVESVNKLERDKTYYTPSGEEWQAPDDWTKQSGISGAISKAARLGGRMGGDERSSLSLPESSSEDSKYRPWEKRIQKGLYTERGDEQEGYDDEFHNRHRENYMDYARPEIEQERSDAGEELVYALAGTGQGESSIAVESKADLEDQHQQGLEEARREGQRLADESRQELSEQRDRMSQLAQSGASADTMRSSLESAGDTLQKKRQGDPVGPVFESLTSGLLAKQQGEQRARVDKILRERSARETSPH